MQHLIRGLHQFREQVVARQPAFYEALAKGQSPDTLFITCADSRIDPSLLTQTDPGNLFVVRNAGNIVAPYRDDEPNRSGEAASIEYAIASLGVSHVVVCGHSHCGAMAAVAQGFDLESLPVLDQWLGNASTTRERLHHNHADIHGDDRTMAAVQENVLAQLNNLRTHPSVARGIKSGTLQLHGWVYMLESGIVLGYDDKAEQFSPLNDSKPRAKSPKPRAQAREEMRASAGDMGG